MLRPQLLREIEPAACPPLSRRNDRYVAMLSYVLLHDAHMSGVLVLQLMNRRTRGANTSIMTSVPATSSHTRSSGRCRPVDSLSTGKV